MGMDTDDALDRLEHLVEASADPWLREGYRRFLAGGRLDEALGLAGLDRQRLCRARRDHHLRQALAQVTSEPVSDWRRCLLLEAEIRRFLALFNGWRTLEAPPERTSALRRALFYARKFGCLPQSAKQLSNILHLRNE
jgi:hypothetical protein